VTRDCSTPDSGTVGEPPDGATDAGRG
jgi:hypothetical protein